MIRKISSSEIFDNYANRMISKRDSIRKGAQATTALSRLMRNLMTIGDEIGTITFAPATINSLSLDLRTGINALSSSTSAEAKGVFQRLINAAHINEGATNIMEASVLAGYAEGDIASLINSFSSDLRKISQEYTTLIARNPNPSPQELNNFYTRNKKAIDFYNQIKNDSAFIRKIDGYAAEGARASAAGRSGIPSESARASSGGVVDTFSKYQRVGVSLIGAVVTMATVKWLYTLGTSDFSNKIYNILKGRNGERHILAVKDAIDCISNISLEPGSPAVFCREKILKNLEAFVEFETVPNITDRAKATEIIEKALTAGEELVSDASVQGSIQNFLVIISDNPGQNLTGYTPLQVAVPSALVGGAVGLTLGGPLWMAIGAVVTGGAGWYFVSKYYEDEIKCISSAADAIVQLNKDWQDAISERENNNLNAPTNNGANATNAKGISKDSLLEQMIGVMQNDKIYNMPGFSNIFVNERRLLKKIIQESGSVSNATKMLTDVNPNINIVLSGIDTSNFNGAITEEVVRQNKPLQDLAKAIITSAKTAKDTLKINRASDINNLKHKLKIKETNMKKESKSITNHELITKTAETKVSYFGDASLGLKDQLTKSYYAGLTGMYNESPPKKSSDYKDLYGFNKETGQDLILESHPKSVTLADAMGKGGLVENNLEQQQKSIYVATNTPSGNFQSKYAQTISYLEKLAKAADSQNKKDVSRLIKQTISKLN
jgi:hypothetical protein